MGIINITPDSFHKDSRFNPFDENFLLKAKEMIENGVDIFDIGGFSTRPNAKIISESEELDRILPAISKLQYHFPETPISIDTFRAKVAESAIIAGVAMINDISGGKFDPEILNIIKKYQVPYILMHSRGELNTMHDPHTYANVVAETLNEILQLANKLEINDIIIDPGFGFSKSLEQNYALFAQLELLSDFNYPILIGISRKSMLFKLLNISVSETLAATSALNLFGLLKNASILRVHDVKEANQIREIWGKLKIL